MSEKKTTPGLDINLAENQYVKELFAILGENGKDTTGLTALIGHVSEMEGFVKRAEDKIADMKTQLAEMKEVQKHPFKTYLQSAVKLLEAQVEKVKSRLAELKINIVNSCKSAVDAFKEKGISALNNIASFFGIKKGLDNWKKEIDVMIARDDKTIAKIEAFSVEYHSAGRAIKNMARVAIGKEPLDAKTEAGKLAKAFAAPYKSQKSALISLKKSIEKAIAKLEQLDSIATEKKAERAIEKKPSLLDRLEKNKERVAQAKLDLPTPERAKVQGVEV